MFAFFRFLIWAIVFLLLCVGLIVAFLPQVVSNEWGRNQIVGMINQYIPGKIEVEDLHLHWGKGQSIKGILLKDPEDSQVIKIDEMKIEASLFQILTQEVYLGEINVRGMTTSLKKLGEKTNLEFALGTSFNKKTPLLNLADAAATLQLSSKRPHVSFSANGSILDNNYESKFDLNLVLGDLQGSSWKKLASNVKKYFKLEEKETFDIQLKINPVNTSILDTIPEFKPSIKEIINALFGNALKIEMQANLRGWNGPVKAFLTGSNGSVHIDGEFKQNNFILNKPLEGKCLMNPHVAKFVFSKNVPLLSTAIGGEKPISVIISPENFSCPVSPFKLSELKIENATLELGKIQFKNEGELKALLNLISKIKDQDLTIWFTPIHFYVKANQLKIERVDCLVNQTYPLIHWGTVNLETHEGNLVLGIPAQTLQSALGAKDLDKDYVLQIHMRSKNGKIRLDEKDALAKISALLAKTHGGKTGKLLGKVFGHLLEKQEEGKIPPPLVVPLPWETELQVH